MYTYISNITIIPDINMNLHSVQSRFYPPLEFLYRGFLKDVTPSFYIYQNYDLCCKCIISIVHEWKPKTLDPSKHFANKNQRVEIRKPIGHPI